MIATIAGFILIILGLFALALQRFYSCVPIKELKRLAARGDDLAAALYRPVAYGASLRLFLWLVFGAGLSFGVWSLQQTSSIAAWAALAFSLAVTVWLLSVRLSVHSVHLATRVAPALRWIMSHLHVPLDAVALPLNRWRAHQPHTGLYEKDDIVDLLLQQQVQADNRVQVEQLELMIRAAHVDERQAASIALPWAKIKHVKASDSIGPVLLDELHASGQQSFVVYDGKPGHIIGTLSLRDAVSAKKGGEVRGSVHTRLTYVHEDFSLRQVLDTFNATGESIVVVINAFEEPVGVISLQMALDDLLGSRPAVDIAYDDRTSVAAWRPHIVKDSAKDSDQHNQTNNEEVPISASSPESTEVVE